MLQGVEEFTEKVAFVEAVTGKAVTYGDVVRDTKRLAKALTSVGLRKGQVMVVVLPNVAEYGIIALGIMSAGGVFSGANPTALVSEIKKQVEASGARGIITDSTNFEKVKRLCFFCMIDCVHIKMLTQIICDIYNSVRFGYFKIP